MGGWQTGGDVFSNVNGVYGTWGHLTGIGDDPVGSAFGLGADFIGFAQTFGSAAAPLFEATKFAEAAATPIINAGLLALLGMGNLSGFGTPDEGQDFSSGAEAFQQIGETLATTGAPGSWTGDGSEAYTDQNGLQELRAKSMQQLDKSVGDVLAKEAGQVNETRQTIDYCSTALTFAIPVAISLNAIPGYGQAASLEFQAAAVAMSVPVAAARFLELTGQSAHNATIVRRAGAGYDRIGSEADPDGPNGCGELSVVSADLRQLSSQQGEVATNIESAGMKTHETTQNVGFSHGGVCALTSAAVMSAVQSRGNAATMMQAASDVLSSRLDSSASAYDNTDHQQQGNIGGELRPN